MDSLESKQASQRLKSQLGSHLYRGAPSQFSAVIPLGQIDDQGDAKWIVIRGQLWGYNDTPCGRPTRGRLIDCPGVGRP
jgi:hypothetical protein